MSKVSKATFALNGCRATLAVAAALVIGVTEASACKLAPRDPSTTEPEARREVVRFLQDMYAEAPAVYLARVTRAASARRPAEAEVVAPLKGQSRGRVSLPGPTSCGGPEWSKGDLVVVYMDPDGWRARDAFRPADIADPNLTKRLDQAVARAAKR